MDHKTTTNRRTPKASPAGRVRIIGGRWRGIPLSFPSRSVLRPTPDRVRETLFNWLQPVIGNARCLDLFAGSGVLGFEALSRGAARAVLVENDAEIVRQLHSSAEKLKTQAAHIVRGEAIQYLSQPATARFEIAFVDPPYGSNLLAQVCERLAQGWLAPLAFVYLEAPAEEGLPPLPNGWSVHRSKRAGQVGYHLLRVERAEGTP